MENKLNYPPFYRLHSEALKMMLGFKDVRSIKAWLIRQHVPIRGSGKDSYILIDEALEALKTEDQAHDTYKPLGKYSRL